MSQPSISSSDRIRELSTINADVPTLVSAAGNAINALTNRPLDGTTNGHADGDIDMEDDNSTTHEGVDAHKEVFTKNARAYFNHLQSIMARLRRQAYALEEAGIIAAEAPTLSTTSSTEQPQRAVAGQGAGVRRAPVAAAQASRQPVDEADRITNGGLGNLDVGYLNSRGNRVGLEKEAELIAEARKMLEEMNSQV